MKKILVPTDFSVQAEIAIDASIKIASITKSEILFYHASPELPKGWEHWPLREQDKFPESRKLEEILKLKMKDFVDRCLDQKLDSRYLINTGKLVDNIETLVKEEGIDLIIMGSHGASGKQEFFIGSNTQKVIRKVHADLLILKEPIEEVNFKKVLFSTNLSISDQEAFAHFLNWIKVFNLNEIHLLTIDTPGFFTQPRILVQERQQDFKKMAANYNFVSHFMGDLTVDTGIRKFAADLGVDLIVISNYERHPLKRIFSGSNVEMLANHSDLPVLSLDRLRLRSA